MYALFDIGGTKTRVAVSDDLQGFGEPIKFDTPQAYGDGLAAVADAITKLAGGKHLDACAGGIRGPLLPDHSGIAGDDILIDWVGKSLARDLEKLTNAPVQIENDAALAGLGEAHFGAGKGYRIVAYHTVSTGVGGARIVDGKIDAASSGFEPGHQTIDIDKTVCPTCESGELEDLISGTALEKRTGKKPKETSQNDPVWDELAHYLAHGLKNTIAYWSPDVIVLGGSMILGDPRIKLEDVERHLTDLLAGLVSPPSADRRVGPPIKDALLADVGGLYGAMALLKG
ncbi:ROK family protein [Candidatus Kaiserbacteria bacterium]|nr:ROK family protein [Candidatus Kaiserbacteria bacterium]